MAKTVISVAKELIAEHGKEHALEVFRKRIEDLGEITDFEGMCKLSGLETAIDYINGKFDK